jgi:antitoxin YefM
MRTVTYTDLRKNLKAYMDSVVDDADEVVINRDGGMGVVLMSLAEYNALAETEYLHSSPAMVRRIKEAEQEIKDGKGERIGLDDLWK